MKKLTVEQQQIVDKLINEFNKLNDKPNEGEFNLIDYNALNAEKNRRLCLEAEINAHNNSMIALIAQVAMDITKKLNVDITKGNLPLIATCGKSNIVIKKDTTVTYHESDVNITINQDNVCVENKTKIIGYSFSYDRSSTKYKTIEEMTSSNYFRDRLLNLIKL
jgi:hypothetical protein